MKEIRNFTRSKGYKNYGPFKTGDAVELSNLEKKLGKTNQIPDGLVEFLKKYNGGSFEECVFFDSPKGPVVAASFLPVSPDENTAITKIFDFFVQELKSNFIPFASDPGGNYFLLGVENEDRNRVYFWDHESHEFYEIAASFEYFLNALQVDS